MKHFFVLLGLASTPLFAGQAAVVTNLSKDSSSVTIEQGNPPQFTEYQIVEGKDEIFGTPEYDRTKAYASWKTACNEWKQSMKEMNTERQLLTLNCSSPVLSKEGDLTTYKSSGSYKMKLRTKERLR